MYTAGDIASKGLRRLLVEAPESPLAPDEYSDFLDSMNTFMAALEADGVRLGYTPVSNVSDLVTIPAGAVRGLIANVALDVAADYGGKVTASLAKQASEGLRVMNKIGLHIGSTSLPPTLPRGAGDYDSQWLPHYFGAVACALLSIKGNTIATITETATVVVKAAGFWEVEKTETLSADITGRITNTSPAEFSVAYTAELSVKASGSTAAAAVVLYKNGSELVASDAAALTTAETAMSIVANVSLQPGDYLELFVADFAGTEDITIVSGNVEAI